MPFTVRDLEDLIRLLDKHPTWMEALRQRMLTKDLLESPRTLKRLSTRVGKVEKTLQALTESVAALTEAQRRHYEEFAAHRQEFLAYRVETEQRFAELREEVATARRRTGASRSWPRPSGEATKSSWPSAQRPTGDSPSSPKPNDAPKNASAGWKKP